MKLDEATRHEDHFGALFDLWPRLKVPVYATPFTAALIEVDSAAPNRARRTSKSIIVPLKGKPLARSGHSRRNQVAEGRRLSWCRAEFDPGIQQPDYPDGDPSAVLVVG